jgi:hypothetical protein
MSGRTCHSGYVARALAPARVLAQHETLRRVNRVMAGYASGLPDTFDILE